MQNLRNHQQVQRRQDRTPRKSRTVYTDVIDPTTARFCTFNLGTKRGIGVVEDDDIKGKKNIRVTVVQRGKTSKITGAASLVVTGTGVKRHIIKHAVKFSPIGVIPHP